MTSDSPARPDAVVSRLSRFDFSRVRVGDLVLWYALSAMVVYALPGTIQRRERPWMLPPREEIQSWYWAATFLLSALGITLSRAMRSGRSLPSLFLLVIGPWPLAYLALALRPGIPHSRMIALGSALVGVVLLVVPMIISPIVIPYVARITAVAGALTSLAFATRALGASGDKAPAPVTTSLSTALVPLSIAYDTGIVAETTVPGGAMARLGRGLLLVTGSGAWYHISTSGGRLFGRRLPIAAPMPREGLVFDAGTPKPLLRVTGLAIDTVAGAVTLYVVHEVWHSEARCVVLQVSAMRLKGLSPADSSWRPVYATQPCLKPVVGFDGYETGGRIVVQADGSLLLTVGDYGQNQTLSTALAQMPNVDYGKTLRIGIDGRRSLNTLGHRNPSGLAADRDGHLWLVEHGPRGGDELNLLKAGANYGWPVVTYGTDFSTYRWRFPAPAVNTFSEPSFVMVPSVGISSLILVRGSRFDTWAGDLVAGSLKGKSLFRFRLNGTRVAYAEPIPVNRRVRDIVEIEDGRLVLWTDEGDLVRLTPEPGVRDEAFAYEPCMSCHGALNEPGTPTAPGLRDVVGRDVASWKDFPFSGALKKVGGRWTEDRLDAFLKSPATFAPGTAMRFAGIQDSAQRRMILSVLRQASAR